MYDVGWIDGCLMDCLDESECVVRSQVEQYGWRYVKFHGIHRHIGVPLNTRAHVISNEQAVILAYAGTEPQSLNNMFVTIPTVIATDKYETDRLMLVLP